MPPKRALLVALTILVIAVAGCAAPTPQVVEKQVMVEVTKVVEKQVTQVVEKQVVVTSTPEPVAAEAPLTLPVDKVRLAVSAKLANLDPVKPGIQPDQITTYLISARLFKLNSDWSITPDLAESMKMSEDGLTATVTLKSGLKYSDGTPIKAEDVAFAFERQRDEKGTWWVMVSGIATAEAPDDTTVIFNMEKPFANLPIALAHMGMSVHPKASIQADKDYFLHPVSSGQYVIKDWVPGTAQWNLVENPNYVGGPSAAKQVEIVSVADATSRVLQLATGQLDFVYDLPLAARDSLPPEVQTKAVSINGMYHIVVNLTLPKDHPLQNADVRKAISMAIDRDEINNKAFFGISKPATGFMYSGVDSGVPVLPNGGKRDIDGAKKLLATTPFAGGFTFKLQPWNRTGWVDVALIIKNNLADLGITVEVEPADDAVAQANIKSGNFEAQFSGNASDPLTLLRNQFVPGNYWTEAQHYNNPAVTQALDDALTAPNEAKKIEAMQLAQTLAYEDLALIPISERSVLVGSRLDPRILDVGNRPPGVNPIIKTMAEAK